jgi:N6-adenosine-specific RNA methylase IME4
MVDKKFTRIAGDLLLDVQSLCKWGIETGTTTPEELRLTVAARRETAIKLIEAGHSQRTVAKLLGVSHQTIMRDVVHDGPKSGPKGTTVNSPATKAKRATAAAKASAKGITVVPTEKYRIIYADPPWDYGAHLQPDYQSSPHDYYPVIEISAICEIPVCDWVEDDAVLFLWVTSPLLEKSFQVVHAWGFEYKACFVWDKVKHNMGNYNSARHEFLFICTRGGCTPDNKQLIDSVQSIERGKHSEKPVEFYDIIETLYTHGRKLELFARQKREGWDVYGHVAELEAAE